MIIQRQSGVVALASYEEVFNFTNIYIYALNMTDSFSFGKNTFARHVQVFALSCCQLLYNCLFFNSYKYSW